MNRNRRFAGPADFAEDARIRTATHIMELDLATIPGQRIGHYRNSARRAIKLYGLGATGARVAQEVGRHGRPNVEVRTGRQPVGWPEVTGAMPDPNTNMIVIVCGDGDEGLFQPQDGRPDSLVTFVLLQRRDNMLVVGDERVATARRHSDLFVTTSDADYVSDLIDNLAS